MFKIIILRNLRLLISLRFRRLLRIVRARSAGIVWIGLMGRMRGWGMCGRSIGRCLGRVGRCRGRLLECLIGIFLLGLSRLRIGNRLGKKNYLFLIGGKRIRIWCSLLLHKLFNLPFWLLL